MDLVSIGDIENSLTITYIYVVCRVRVGAETDFEEDERDWSSVSVDQWTHL